MTKPPAFPLSDLLGASRLAVEATSRQWIAQGIGHFDLLNDSATYEQIRRWLA